MTISLQITTHTIDAAPTPTVRNRPLRVIEAIRVLIDGAREGHAALRRYNNYRARRLDHDAALRKAFGLPQS